MTEEKTKLFKFAKGLKELPVGKTFGITFNKRPEHYATDWSCYHAEYCKTPYCGECGKFVQAKGALKTTSESRDWLVCEVGKESLFLFQWRSIPPPPETAKQFANYERFCKEMTDYFREARELLSEEKSLAEVSFTTALPPNLSN